MMCQQKMYSVAALFSPLLWINIYAKKILQIDKTKMMLLRIIVRWKLRLFSFLSMHNTRRNSGWFDVTADGSDCVRTKIWCLFVFFHTLFSHRNEIVAAYI